MLIVAFEPSKIILLEKIKLKIPAIGSFYALVCDIDILNTLDIVGIIDADLSLHSHWKIQINRHKSPSDTNKSSNCVLMCTWMTPGTYDSNSFYPKEVFRSIPSKSRANEIQFLLRSISITNDLMVHIHVSAKSWHEHWAYLESISKNNSRSVPTSNKWFPRAGARSAKFTAPLLIKLAFSLWNDSLKST